MSDEVLKAAVNDVIERAIRLDEEVAQAFAFRALLEGLDRHYDPPILGDQADAILMIRAAVIRSLIGCVSAIYDPEDRRRGNRASLGQIVHALKSEPLSSALQRAPSPFIPKPHELTAVSSRYLELVGGTKLENVRKLRNDSIAHNLIGMLAGADVPYDDLYELQGDAEQLLRTLSDGIGLARPTRVDALRGTLTARAQLFWSTYVAGMRPDASRGV